MESFYTASCDAETHVEEMKALAHVFADLYLEQGSIEPSYLNIEVGPCHSALVQ